MKLLKIIQEHKIINRIDVSKSILKKIVLVTILSLSIFNCSKDDDDDDDDFQMSEPTTQELLIGKWHVDILSTGEATDCQAQTFYHFLDSENATYQLVQDDTGILPTGAEVIGDCAFSPEETTTYTLVNNQDINIVNEYGITTLKIVSINDTTLVITRDVFTGVETTVLTKEL